MPLPGCRWALGPFAPGQPSLKTGSNRFNGRLETRKISAWLHADDAAAIGAPKSAQQNLLAIPIEKGRCKAMPPQALGLTARAVIGPGPLKIAALTTNLIEFYANQKYHFINSFEVL
jgi:hypothetical protein